MLQRLYIKNYALIDRLEMNFSDRMNIITGETGAGKSIILGGLGLMLGNRATTTTLFNPSEKCVVEGTFQIEHYSLKAFFEKNELDYETQTIIRREITPSGSSRAFINDTPVKLPLLKELTEQLVSVVGQHQTTNLQDTSYHLFIIDTLANHADLLSRFKDQYRAFQQNRQRLTKLEREYEQLQKDIDFVQFQLNELKEANLGDATEQDRLEKELSQLENAESIREAIGQSVMTLEEQEETAVLQQLKVVQSALNAVVRYVPALEEFAKRVESVSIELQDLTNDLGRLGDEMLLDPERIAELSERLDLLNRLQKKHRVASLQALLDVFNDLAARNQSVDSVAEDIAQLKKQLDKQQKELLENGQPHFREQKTPISGF